MPSPEQLKLIRARIVGTKPCELCGGKHGSVGRVAPQLYCRRTYLTIPVPTDSVLTVMGIVMLALKGMPIADQRMIRTIHAFAVWYTEAEIIIRPSKNRIEIEDQDQLLAS